MQRKPSSVVTTTVSMHPKSWKRFQELAASTGRTASGWLRCFIDEQLRLADKQAAKEATSTK